MLVDEAVLRVQSAYPKIYLACHTRHQTARTTAHGLSQRDASILAHLSERYAMAQSDLAKHLSVAKSTLSEALRWLEECQYVIREPDPHDSRTVRWRLSRAGAQAMSGTSVLESSTLARILESLDPADRARAVEGLEVLAHATLHLKGEAPSS